jgi:hypothetical protein
VQVGAQACGPKFQFIDLFTKTYKMRLAAKLGEVVEAQPKKW